MSDPMMVARAAALLCVVWAVLIMGRQVMAARGGGRTDFSRPSGSPSDGVRYNFTAAMSPTHKESARLHKGKFSIGIALHVGVGLTLAAVLLAIVNPSAAATLLRFVRPVLVVSLFAGLYLAVRRTRSADLRAMSRPDDFVAILASCGLVALAGVIQPTSVSVTVLLAYASLLLIYMPFGKLRHAAFFFAARADYGRRLGHRGVYPPPPETAEGVRQQ